VPLDVQNSLNGDDLLIMKENDILSIIEQT